MKLLILSLIFVSSLSTYAQFTKHWSLKTEGPIYASSITDDNNLYIGSGDGVFYALNKNDGTINWTYKTDGNKFSSAALSGENIVFASNTGILHCLDTKSNNPVWSFNSKGEQEKDIWDYYLSTPLIEGQTIYWGCGDSCVYAIDATTGKELWNFKSEGIIHANPVLKDGTLFISSFDGHLYAIDPKDGALKWKFKTLGAQYFPIGAIPKAPLIKDGIVYFGSRDYNLYALDAQTGKCHWNYREPQGWIIASPIFHDGHLYFGLSDGHKMICMNAKTGIIRWKKEVNMRIFGEATIIEEALVFGSHNGLLYALNPQSGEEIARFETLGHQENYHQVFDNNDKFRADFELYGANYKTSEKKLLNMGSILSTPMYENGVVYFTSADGHVYAVKYNIP